ncbi:DUF4920 domain-containing protein [Flavobacteriales bacterium]|nr:DUF4920 domain-containing protein [Flavobacteriales bacterium]
MNFRTFLNLFFILSLISIYSQDNQTKFYGEKFNLKNVDNLLELSSTKVKVKGEIISTCPMKGCWMNMLVSNDTVLVRFKDYGFFVPKQGIEGSSAIINGFLSIDTLSVAQLRHYAEDAGKKTEEIMKIKKPKITLSFLADGVAIQE